MLKPLHYVKQSDVRPARPDGTCFYCCQPLGHEHKVGCVIRRKTVIVAVTIQLLKSVPEDWDESMIESYMNESSSCSNNIVDDIVAQQDRLGEERCMCNFVEGKYLREATEADEQQFTVPPEQ